MTLSHVFSETDALYTFYLKHVFPEERNSRGASPLAKQRRFKFWLQDVSPEKKAEIVERVKKENH